MEEDNQSLKEQFIVKIKNKIKIGYISLFIVVIFYNLNNIFKFISPKFEGVGELFIILLLVFIVALLLDAYKLIIEILEFITTKENCK
ncbi:hypothetical protein [Orenia marismortui]|uniref:Uncharacterized protein n=1 Tax=Orenia marismortui TaxID=46469 RepID=A0A4R8GVW7_9FIRM|nr:hypothetical protein [Orenia marismortui]TDX46343.1 hypothetical protein C7959_14210 [Orenia marismortui]